MPKPPSGTTFAEAVDWFRARVPMTDDQFNALDAASKRKAFTVSGVAQLDLVNEVMHDLENAIRDGVPLEEFRTQVQQKLEKAWGGTVQNPGARVETIYRTNVQLAYAAGRYAQLTHPDALAARPVWVYDAVLDSRTTAICQERNGITKLASDPWWRTNTPPLHHRCRSGLRAIRREGATLTDREPANEPAPGFGLAPDGAPWEPDLQKYPSDLRAAFIRKRDTDPARVSSVQKGQNIARAVAVARDLGSNPIVNDALFNTPDTKNNPAAFDPRSGTLYLNPNSSYWSDPAGNARRLPAGYWSSTEADHPIWHERAHELLWNASPAKFRKASRTVFSNAFRMKLEGKVSEYALENALEFIAEVYAGLRAGKQYDADVMATYNLYGGDLL